MNFQVLQNSVTKYKNFTAKGKFRGLAQNSPAHGKLGPTYNSPMSSCVTSEWQCRPH